MHMKAIDGPEKNSLGSDEIAQSLQALGQTSAELETLINGLSPSQMRMRRSDDEFSVTENLCHLRDIEVEGYKVRIQRILAEDEPHLADLDGSRLAVERNYNVQSAVQVLKDFRRARTQNLRILDSIQKSQFRREGYLVGVGKISLEKLVGLMQQHDEGHISDLEILCRWITANGRLMNPE